MANRNKSNNYHDNIRKRMTKKNSNNINYDLKIRRADCYKDIPGAKLKVSIFS